MNNSLDLELLRKLIRLKIGTGLRDAKSCQQLSIAIFLRSGDYVSRTTIMRLFDLLPVRSNELSQNVMKILWNYVNDR